MLSKRVEGLLVVLICLFPLCLLFRYTYGYADDWNNHLWFSSYYAEYFKQHFQFPLVINSDRMIGLPTPLFYANGFYLITGLLSTVLGSVFAVRLVLFVFMICQFLCVRRTLLVWSQEN